MKNDVKLGQLVEGSPPRDAVHVAVVPVVAGAILKPGERVSLHGGRAFVAEDEGVGVVDPFLASSYVAAGESFWLLLKPGTITSLRHEWEHPAFPLVDEAELAERALLRMGNTYSANWLANVAEEAGVSYSELVAAAESGEGAHFGTDTPDELRTDEFWKHVEAVTGKKFSDEHVKNTPFSCSC